MRLAAFQLFDRRSGGVSENRFADEPMVTIWMNVMFLALRAGRKEIIKRLLDVRKESTQELDAQIEIPLGAALLLENDNPARSFQIIDEAARDVLDTGHPRHMKEMALGLLFSPHRALGILAARGMIPLLPSSQAVGILDSILEARDILNLPPDDPISDIVSQRNAEHEEDDAKLREARQTLDAKAQEVRGLKEKLDGLQMEIARREKKAAADAAAKLEEAPLKELRRKVEELKSALTERHGERNQLRRELQKAHDDLEALRQTATASPEEEAEAARDEENLLLPQDAPEVHPVRLADYPKQFLQTLGHFPRHVARAAVIMIGRLSAGEPAAFVGRAAAQGHPQRDAPAHRHQLPPAVPPLAGTGWRSLTSSTGKTWIGVSRRWFDNHSPPRGAALRGFSMSEFQRFRFWFSISQFAFDAAGFPSQTSPCLSVGTKSATTPSSSRATTNPPPARAPTSRRSGTNSSMSSASPASSSPALKCQS